MSDTLRPNSSIHAITPPADSDSLRPEPRDLVTGRRIDLRTLRRLSNRSVIEVGQLDRETVIELCKFAALLEAVEISAFRPLAGKIVITAFFEASTRTRTSFESAALRLDGRVISIPDGAVTGVKKGESLEDIGEMFNAYGDLVIVRHGETDALQRLMTNLRLPLID